MSGALEGMASGKVSIPPSDMSVGKSGTHGSRQSEKVTFPNSGVTNGLSQKSDLSELDVAKRNPFKMPPDNDIFMLRDKERQRKKFERKRQRALKVHEKTTYLTRMNTKTSGMIHPMESEDEDDDVSDEDDGKAVAVKDDPQFTLAVTKDRRVEKESLAGYIAKKREMFLVQYSLGVKRDEMRKLEEIAVAEERKLELAEQYLEEDAAMFDEFLKENDKNSVEAIKIAEAETKAKLEKVAEIKRINAQMMAIRSEISKYEDTLKEYQMYKKFLEALTPKVWLADRLASREKRLEAKKQARRPSKMPGKKESDTISEYEGDMLLPMMDSPASKRRGSVRMPRKSMQIGASGLGARDSPAMKMSTSSTAGKLMPTTDSADAITPSVSDDESDEEQTLYFGDPQQLLDIFAELEEQNLSLIQNSQDTEEALEEMKQTIKVTQSKMDKETSILTEQIDKLKKAIKKEVDKAKDLETKARLFSFGEFKSEDQELMLEALNRKVEDVYKHCIGDNEANIGTLQMLTNIENRLEELFEEIEMLPQDKVEAAEKAKEKDRRLRQREDKVEQQRLHQEERIRRALERAKAEPKKRMGRPLVFRSEPPSFLKEEDDGSEQATREEEELAYYFTSCEQTRPREQSMTEDSAFWSTFDNEESKSLRSYPDDSTSTVSRG